MQTTSNVFKALWGNPLHEEEVRLDIAGVSYYHDTTVSVNISGGVFANPDIGNCASRQIDLVIRPQGVIPRQAEIKVYLRLKLETQYSEWLSQGVFYTATRSENKIDNTLSIHGFDAMLKSGQVWLDQDHTFVNWPLSEWDAVRDIASRIGVEIDTRTVLNDKYKVDYPVDENGDMTMTDILECIATANGGNWVITNEGKLLLLRYGDVPPETNYLVTEHGEAILIGGVRILV